MRSKPDSLAQAYFAEVHAARKGGVDAEHEAQLTVPWSELMRGVAVEAMLPNLELLRETREERIRPDFAVLAGGRFAGFVELKAPDMTIETSRWTGRNAKQWEHLRTLDALIVSNGREMRLFSQGDIQGPDVSLPYDAPVGWTPASLVDLLRRFIALRPRPVTKVADLACRLAPPTRELRDRLHWLLDNKTAGDEHIAAKKAFSSWRDLIHPHCSHEEFANDVAQVVSYGLVLAALTGATGISDADGTITAARARTALHDASPVISASFGPLLDNPKLTNAVRAELGALEALVSAVNPAKVNKSTDARGEPWLYFYEDFLEIYDPEARKQTGVYFTPTAAVRAMVRIADELLVSSFDKRLGFADPKVVTLDPATGSGTFPLAVIDRAVERARLVRGKAGPRQAALNLVTTLHAFELLPGPYAVTHLRIAELLNTLGASANAPLVILTDTMESPEAGPTQQALFGDADVLAVEQARARTVKLAQRVTVVLGNPPYRRESQTEGSGGWVLSGVPDGRTKPLFADLTAGLIFSQAASLYNKYVYFWRWALWKVFEAEGSGQGIVTFITASSWLAGPAFAGLRQLARELCDEIYVVDLGGDNKGTNHDPNIFAIETPVAIVVLVRSTDASDRMTLASVQYRRIEGTCEAKLAELEAIACADNPLGGEWYDAPGGARDPFTPPTGHASWQDLPLLADLFPWVQAGCKFNRLWPIGPHDSLLEKRWERFAASSPTERPVLFSKTAVAGRDITTKVGGLPRLADVTSKSNHRPIVRYGYRSFDRQWAFDDPRITHDFRPMLWQTQSARQLFLTTQMTDGVGAGPGLTVSAYVPDLHYFCGRGGKDVLPLYRDASAKEPNVTRGLLDALGTLLSMPAPSPEDLAAYVYLVLSSPRYQERFAQELRTPQPRVPVTASEALFREAVSSGRRLLWLHTFAERLRDAKGGRGPYVPSGPAIGWRLPVETVPESSADIEWLEEAEELRVGDGIVTGVRRSVWEFSVSGMRVVTKWLGYRTQKGSGRSTSSKNPLDHIRPELWFDEWNDELLDLLRVLTLTVEQQPKQASLVDRICDGPLLGADQLPAPSDKERKPPATIAYQTGGTLF